MDEKAPESLADYERVTQIEKAMLENLKCCGIPLIQFFTWNRLDTEPDSE